MIVGDLVRPGDSIRDAMADVDLADRLRGDQRDRRRRPRRPRLHHRLPLHRARPRSDPGVVRDRRRDGADDPDAVAELLSGRVGIDEAKMSLESHAKLARGARPRASSWSPPRICSPACGGSRTSPRSTRSPRPRGSPTRSTRFIEERGLAGRTEREVALAAEARMRELGAEDPSFPSIVAAGPNGALPHAVPGDREIAAGEYVVVDMGAIVDGYCSDCTRTLVDGEPDPSQRAGLRARPGGAARRPRGDPRRGRRPGRRRGRPRDDRRGRLRRAVRPRARAWGRDRGPRAAAALEALRGHAAGRRRRHRRARHLRARASSGSGSRISSSSPRTATGT